jgi:hypothetical protein
VSFVTKGGTMLASMSKTFMSPDFLTKFLEEKFKCVNLSLPNKFLAHISLLFLFFSPEHTVTTAAACFDELILDTEMYEQS